MEGWKAERGGEKGSQAGRSQRGRQGGRKKCASLCIEFEFLSETNFKENLCIGNQDMGGKVFRFSCKVLLFLGQCERNFGRMYLMSVVGQVSIFIQISVVGVEICVEKYFEVHVKCPCFWPVINES